MEGEQKMYWFSPNYQYSTSFQLPEYPSFALTLYPPTIFQVLYSVRKQSAVR